VLVRGREWVDVAWRGAIGVTATVFACLSYSWFTLPDVRPLRTRNPGETAFMRLRADEARAAGRDTRIRQQWTPFSGISPVLKRAVTVTEDAAFWSHDGVDYAEIRASLRAGWLHGGVFRGASTLTQQLAKNLYLSPSRNLYRKLEELLITRRLEASLSKTRIFELYLNEIEWGDGIWGADAAARAYFNTSAANLSNDEAALLAGAIINPRLYSPAHPNARLRRRQAIVLARLGGGAAASDQLPLDSGGATGDADTDKNPGQ